MPQRKEISWSQLRVGLFVGTSLIVFAVGIFFISGQVGFLNRRYVLHAYFADASGLREGALVQLAGIPAGNVSRFRISASHDPNRAVEVILKINRAYLKEIRSDSIASVETAGLLGESYVNITRGSPSMPIIPPGGEVKTQEETDIKKVVQNTNDVITNLRDLSAKLNTVTGQITTGQGSIGKLIYDSGLYDRMNAATGSLQAIANNLQRGQGTMGKLLVDDAAYNKLNTTLDRANTLMDSIQTGKGTIGRLISDPALYNNLNKATVQANQLLDQAQHGPGTLAKLLTDATLYNRLNQTLDNLNTITGRITNGEGTLGLLSTDKTLYNNLGESAKSLRNFLAEFQKNPKKYLTLRIHLF